MDVTPLVREGTQIIQSYKGGAFRVSNVQHAGAIIVTPEQTRAWDVEPADLSVDDFSVIEADVILLGTGARLVHLAPELRTCRDVVDWFFWVELCTLAAWAIEDIHEVALHVEKAKFKRAKQAAWT